MYAFQEETGKNGTPHLQGIISLHKRARWPEFGLSSSIHWEVARDVKYSYNYCTKQATRTGEVYTKNFEVPVEIRLIKELRPWQEEVLRVAEGEPDGRTVHWFWEPIGNAGKSSFGFS